LAALVEAFALGVLSAASPCLLPLYPGFLGYLVANSPALAGRRVTAAIGIVILGGVMTCLLVVGVVVSVLSIPLAPSMSLIIPLADLVLIVLGGALLAGRDPFARLAGFHMPRLDHPVGGAFIYGVVLGPLALPCAGAFLVALLAISTSVPDTAVRILQFAAFGLGFGLPLVGLSILTAAGRQQVVRLIVARYAVLSRIAGAALVAAGAWDLARNLPNMGASFL
jgi:cytochrome c-type biogenesis protein